MDTRLSPRRHGLGPDNALHPPCSHPFPAFASSLARKPIQQLAEEEDPESGFHRDRLAEEPGIRAAFAHQPDGQRVVLSIDRPGWYVRDQIRDSGKT